MDALKKYLKTFIKEVNLDNLMGAIMRDERFKDYYITLNHEQLENGVLSTGNEIIPHYSWGTVWIKRKKGQQSNWVTLKDTGKFYKSFRITVHKGGFTVNANGKKGKDDLFEKYTIDVLGLNPENTLDFERLVAAEIKTKILKLLQVY
jgi:hypothetical protein